MSAGTSISQKRTGILSLALLVLALGAVATTQTGQVAPPPKFTATDANGDPCSGCKVYVTLSGTTTPSDSYTTAVMNVANTNPVVLDASGRATIFLNPTIAYRLRLTTAADVDIYTVDGIGGAYSGVISATAANTRGVQIARSSAEAGLSVCSNGGSGKCYALLSNTSGAMRLQDDSDGTPRFELTGNDANVTLTGAFSVAGGTLAVTGAGTHTFDASVSGANIVRARNTSSNSAAYGGFAAGNNSTANGLTLWAMSSAYSGGIFTANSGHVESTLAGGLTLAAGDSAGDVRIYAGNTQRMHFEASNGYTGIGTNAPGNNLHVVSTADGIGAGGIRIGRADASYLILNMDDGGASTAWGSIQAGDSLSQRPLKLQPDGSYVLMPTQPAFLAYNSATDSYASAGSTLDFDAEVFDIGSNFASDTFTAPTAGVYHFCASVDYSDNGASTLTFSFNIAGVSYQFFRSASTTEGSASGCVYASMTATQTATVVTTTGDTTVDVEGSASPRITTFSGRLMQ